MILMTIGDSWKIQCQYLSHIKNGPLYDWYAFEYAADHVNNIQTIPGLIKRGFAQNYKLQKLYGREVTPEIIEWSSKKHVWKLKLNCQIQKHTLHT